ncbi:MAG: hypothetical protein ABMA25_07615 [Ilumatobacteraceae bacterium]
MDDYRAGLRCQDVNSGLRTFDAASPSLTPLKKTRLVGMAADLASLVRGSHLISDMASLETVAAAELDIPPTSFDGVIDLLDAAGLVELTRDAHGDVAGLTSEVPYYQDLYVTLGATWRGRRPSQLEEEMVAVVDQLASGPFPAEMLVERVGVDPSDVERILQLGSDSHLIKSASGVEGTILYSPFTAFENPALLSELAEKHGSDQLLAEFDALRNRQGLAVSPDRFPLLYDAVGRGLLLAPSVKLPTGGDQAFATLPYTLDRNLLLGEKPVLDKALAVVACIRCGEEFGGYSDLPSALNAINKLLREGELNPHSSSARQYRLMRNKGIVAYGPDPMPWGKWIVPTLIDTEDNRRALEIARDLISLGEPMAGRNAESARDLLSTDAIYLNPMKTVSANRPRLAHKEAEYSKLVAAVMGYGTA